jgi:hypothetical protein
MAYDDALDGRVFQRARPELVDSDAIYCSGEDNLRLTVFNATAGLVVALEGRFMRCDGVVVPIVERQVPTSDRVASVSLITLAEGFLGNVQVRATTGSPAAGKCFAIVELVRGRAGAVQPLATLLEGYVSDVQRLAWPGSALRSSVDTPGVSSIITGTDPAAGVECNDAVPAGARWEVLSWFATLVTSAAVANRVVTLIIDDGVSTLWTCDASAAQLASLTRNYNAYATGGAPDLTGATFRLPGPFPMDLPAGSRIRTSTALIDVGDNWGAPKILVRERIAG